MLLMSIHISCCRPSYWATFWRLFNAYSRAVHASESKGGGVPNAESFHLYLPPGDISNDLPVKMGEPASGDLVRRFYPLENTLARKLRWSRFVSRSIHLRRHQRSREMLVRLAPNPLATPRRTGCRTVVDGSGTSASRFW